MKSIHIYLLIFAVFGLTYCGKKKSNPSEQEDKYSKLTTLVTPEFSGDTALAYVKKQVSFGPRVPNTKAHRLCGDFILYNMMQYGCKVTTQSFVLEAYDGTQMELRNIIASINPDAKKRIVIAAHWDTRHVADADSIRKNEPIPGANDGGSGVAVLMELARAIGKDTSKPTIGIDFIFFDGEDHGQPDDSGLPQKENTWCLGSQYWSKNKHIPGYAAYYGILLDMVGGKNAKFAMDGTSMNFAPDIAKKV
ncbi:MAG: M28 family peptidase, partial [Cytophagales bacterium]|nr:M28 family peptidase [Cytophagales bacterium]